MPATATKSKSGTKPAPKVKATGTNGKSAAKATSPVQGREDLSTGGFTYPAVLIEGTQEQQENGNWQLLMIFERHDRQFSDGNQAKVYVRATTWFVKSGEAAGPGSEADIVSSSFAEATGDGLDVLSDASIESFIGHSFILTDEKQDRTYEKNGKTYNAYLTTCTEYLGEDYEYEGKVSIIQSKNDSAGGTASDFDPAAHMANLFSGQDLDDLRNGGGLALVKDDPQLAEVKSVLGKPTRGGLVKPKSVLVDLLISEGYATDEDGIFTATADG